MEYIPLKIVFYDNKSNFDDEYESRINSYSAFKTGLSIYPFDRGQRIVNEKLELFYIHLMKHDVLKDTIYKNSNTIIELQERLPEIANDKLFLSQIIEEIQSTNDIEGVQSTRQEIGEALQRINTKEKIRFKGIVKMYANLGEKNYQKIEEITKIRKIFDELFSHDIPEDEQPDGKLFRKNVVYIGKGDKHVHQGNANEETIIRDLNKLVMFMNRKDVPFLLKCVVSHYYFEYIHPFYDGNGRMGRFLMSNYLSRKLDSLTGVSISNSVINSKKQYEKSFSEVSNPRNKGDLTLFVEAIYDLIINGQKEIIKDLKSAVAKIENVTSYLKKLPVDNEESEILFILAQNHLFDILNEPVKAMDVRKIRNLSNHKAKQYYDHLEELGYIEVIGRNPKTHKLTEMIISNID